MRGQKNPSFSPPALGGASLLVIFAVLALTIFALLSLSTVRADGRLSEASAQAVRDYYAADRKAQAYLAWLRTGEGAPDPAVVHTSTVTIDYDDHSAAIHFYTVPISDAQELQVKVRVSGTDYKIMRWQAVPTGEWETDDGMDLWDVELY